MKKLILAAVMFITLNGNAQSKAQIDSLKIVMLSDSANYFMGQYIRYHDLFEQAKTYRNQVKDPKLQSYVERYFDSTMKYYHLLQRQLNTKENLIPSIKLKSPN